MKFFQVLITSIVDKGLWHIEELYLVTEYMHEEQFLAHCNNTNGIF
jgi:hypothetical protein